MLRRSARREVAIYLRGSALWVADFIDGDGHVVDAATWIRFNCGSVSTYHARRRMIRESALPVSRELSMRIEQLHQAKAAHGGVGSAGQSAKALRARLGRALGIIFRRRVLRDSAQASSRKDQV